MYLNWGKIHVVTYVKKIKECPNCKQELSLKTVKYLNEKSKEVSCTIKYCKKCNINYMNINNYRMITQDGKNSVFILDKVHKEKELPNEKKLHVVVVPTDFKYCPKCQGPDPLIYSSKNIPLITGKKGGCYTKRCYHCHINLISKKYLDKFYCNGLNKNIIVDEYIKSEQVVINQDTINLSMEKINEMKEVARINSVINVVATDNKIEEKALAKDKEKLKKESLVVEHPKREEKNIKLSEVFIYKSINNKCKKNHPEFIEQIPLSFKNIKTGGVQKIYGFYCKKCKKNFISYEAITKYTDKYFVPQFKCNISQELKGELKQKSILSLYGYTVKANALSDKHRHAIIDYVIEKKIIHPTKIISLLEFNINFRKGNKSMNNAIEKWYDDIKYVYKLKKH